MSENALPGGARRRGFTLIELLVATAITAALVGFMVVVVANVSGFWKRSSGRLAAEAQARFILDRLTVDLQSALYRDDGQVWLAADVLNDPGNSGLWQGSPRAVKPTDAAGVGLRYDASALTRATFGQAGTWLRFFTIKRGTNTNAETVSAPAAVGWQIIRRAASVHVGDLEQRYFLHRAEVRPERTLEAGFDITSAVYLANGGAAAFGEPGSIRAPSVETIVGDNVIDFGVRFYAHDETGALQSVFPIANETSYRARAPFPEVADIFVRILSDEGARLIADFETDPVRGSRPPEYASDRDYWWPLAVAHSYVFTRRVVLPARGL